MNRLLDKITRLSLSVLVGATAVSTPVSITYSQTAPCRVASSYASNGDLVVDVFTDNQPATHSYLSTEIGGDDQIMPSSTTNGLDFVRFTYSASSLSGASGHNIYGHINGIQCQDSGRSVASVPQNQPEPPPDDSTNAPVDSTAGEKYEAARAATEQARLAATCVENASNAARSRLELADTESATALMSQAETCADSLDNSLAIVEDANNYWAALGPQQGGAANQQADVARWTNEVQGLNDSVDPIYNEAKNAVDTCAGAEHTIACSRDPDNYDPDNVPGGSGGGGGSLDSNPCFNDRIDSAIYNSTMCQNQRGNQQNQAEDSEKQRAIDECNERKPEGAVWVVFADQCATFVEFGGIAISYVLTFASIIAGVMFVAASFKYLSSKGDPSALADARDMMINAAVGMVLVATAFAIVQLLNSSFGFAGGAVNLLPFFEFNPI